MSVNSSHRKQEAVVYLVLWIILSVAPVISIQFHHADNAQFPWNELFDVWTQILILFGIFLLHNFLLAPLLVYKQKRLRYFTYVAMLTACFVVLQCIHRPDIPERPPMHEPEMEMEMEPEMAMEPPRPIQHEGFQPKGMPPIFFGQHDMMMTIILILMLGMNVGVKLYFKQRRDQQRLDELEKENLHQQLEYLRYQINPHFLMNTLNNIHALVDIDGERAKETIVELSKIMRFALYEGAQERVPLGRDVAFMQSYIKLMRLRFTDKVDIQVDIPEQLPERDIPPMMFITFVENAFKHGVSYQQPSFIHIRLEATPTQLIFTCSNSKVPRSEHRQQGEGGVGLQNVRRRLALIYGDHCALNIHEDSKTYNIKLEIPLS